MFTPDGKPIIGQSELKDRHAKSYVEASVIDAIESFRIREGMGSFSEALRAMLLLGFQHPSAFGGYVIK